MQPPRHRSPSRDLGALACLGIVLLAIYAAYNFVLLQLPRELAHPRASLISDLQFWSALVTLPLPRPLGAPSMVTLALVMPGLMLGGYVLALWLTWRMPVRQRNTAIVLGFAVLFSLTSVLTLPTSSSDLYMYIQYARVFNVYHANPYITPPAVFATDPYLPFGDWNDATVPYGPAWTYAAIVVGRPLGDDVVANILGFRAFLAALNVANMVLIAAILRRIASAFGLAGLLLYAWNPIVVLKGSEHVEPLAVLWILVSVYCYLDGRRWVAAVALAVSALTKFITGPLLAVYLLFLLRSTPLRVASVAAGLATGVVVLAFMPVWGGLPMLAQLAQDPSTAAPGGLVSARTVAFALAATLAGAWAAVQRPTGGGSGNLLRGWAVTLIGVSVFVSPTQYAWYVLPLVAVASLVASTSAAIVVVSVAVSTSTLVTTMLAGMVNPYVPVPISVFRLVWWTPPLLALAWSGREPAKLALSGARLRIGLIRRSLTL